MSLTDSTRNAELEPSPSRTRNVFASERWVSAAKPVLPKGLRFNHRHRMDGLEFLKKLPDELAAACFFDPQYRAILDHLAYGNERESRGRKRASLPQMSDDMIHAFVLEIARALMPTGHLFFWMDKFNLINGFLERAEGSGLGVVDLITWDKGRVGMGYRTRRRGEYLAVFQKPPQRAKGVWKHHGIPDVWLETVERGKGVHPKPVGLQAKLIEAVSNPGEIILDPAAGSFSVMEACRAGKHQFLGCDING